jgi:hypothetical protein
MMDPFFPFYGGKYKLALLLGKPKCDHVIEPFAGSAGYSTYWEPPNVTLVERDPVIFGVWKYLQGASKHDIARLPSRVLHVDADLPPGVCQEARWLIGFWLNHGLSRPQKSLCNWGRTNQGNFWSANIQRRIIRQLEQIRHWTIIEGSYEDAPDIEAHYLIDPPYYRAGKSYKFNHIHYGALAEWCVSRKGFVQVCEAEGAPWLPFEQLAIQPNHHATEYTAECVFEQDNRGRQF